ncbi:MAG: bifunctional oligoribonuclease/PAP phosphatase NrnA [Chitinophagales bacterium]|nr:bifunctional oligoribonuclease/PAP phosphatase NrnA [Chitinophagales bacterium]MDW8427443.1 bifunctional oligoribonuclease/PAP phosphatase NrnA [Chitinophagales bacterium]
MHPNEAVSNLLRQPRTIVITTHQRPDGDAMGSSLALFHLLSALGHNCSVITPTVFPAYFLWMPGISRVIVYPQNPHQAELLTRQASLFFCVDFNQLYRNGELGKLIAQSSAPKVLIDHHLQPEDAFTYLFWDARASSSSEMVYRFIQALNFQHLIDHNVATCLYAGLLTDTDRFRIPTTTPAVHRMAADLLERGADHVKAYSRLFENFSRRRMDLFRFALFHRFLMPENLPVGIIYLEPDDLTRFAVQPGDTEGLVNYPLLIEDITVSALITPEGTGAKLSLRSKGDFSVEKICREHFGGGGHFNAAGANSPLPVRQTVEQLIAIFAALEIPHYTS